MTRDLSDAELVEHLRRAAAVWFKNTDLLLLEELIRRYARATNALHEQWERERVP